MNEVTNIIEKIKSDFETVKTLIVSKIPYANNLKNRQWNRIRRVYTNNLEKILLSGVIRSQHLFDYIITSSHPIPEIASQYQFVIDSINVAIETAVENIKIYPQFKSVVENIISNMLTSIDDVNVDSPNEDFKNWINELYIFNYLITLPNYTLIKMEETLSNGNSVDYLFEHKETKDKIYIDVVTLQKIDPSLQESSESLSEFINSRIRKKYDNKFHDATESGVFLILPIIEYQDGLENFEIEIDSSISLPMLTLCKNTFSSDSEIILLEINTYLSKLREQRCE